MTRAEWERRKDEPHEYLPAGGLLVDLFNAGLVGPRKLNLLGANAFRAGTGDRLSEYDALIRADGAGVWRGEATFRVANPLMCALINTARPCYGPLSRQGGVHKEVIGYPLHPMPGPGVCHDPDVKRIALHIHKRMAFKQLPILADACEDAGLDDDELLAHLRDTKAKHVRGCWALDLVMGRHPRE